ncbi:MAG: MerR family transcriptional regulator [Deltaproteobacteria bacterium]|jgi:DNA-binding transcriptional MerR regulator|nr:MerR family transcriptional regulator [Deltaproteobacteria bacterium]
MRKTKKSKSAQPQPKSKSSKGRGLGPNAEGPLFFKLSDISSMLELEVHVLRYWEKQFPIIKPVKINDRRQLYSQYDVLLFTQIKRLLYDEGYTLAGALKKLIEDPPAEIDDGDAQASKALSEHRQKPLFANLPPPTKPAPAKDASDDSETNTPEDDMAEENSPEEDVPEEDVIDAAEFETDEFGSSGGELAPYLSEDLPGDLKVRRPMAAFGLDTPKWDSRNLDFKKSESQNLGASKLEPLKQQTYVSSNSADKSPENDRTAAPAQDLRGLIDALRVELRQLRDFIANDQKIT